MVLVSSKNRMLGRARTKTSVIAFSVLPNHISVSMLWFTEMNVRLDLLARSIDGLDFRNLIRRLAEGEDDLMADVAAARERERLGYS